MSSRAARTRFNRRDRRKAKQSDWKRAGTSNPKRPGHHPYDARSGMERTFETRKEKGPALQEPYSDGGAPKNEALSRALRVLLGDSA